MLCNTDTATFFVRIFDTSDDDMNDILDGHIIDGTWGGRDNGRDNNVGLYEEAMRDGMGSDNSRNEMIQMFGDIDITNPLDTPSFSA